MLSLFVVLFTAFGSSSYVFQMRQTLENEFLLKNRMPRVGRNDVSIPVVKPFDGMKIDQSCIFSTGVYNFDIGVYVVSDNVVVDFGGSTIIGEEFKNTGVSAQNVKNVVIRNGIIRNYYYAIKFVHSEAIQIENMDLSFNYFDPRVFDKTPPWLDINVVPASYGDQTNLGGGIFMNFVKGGQIVSNKLQFQENGMDLFNVEGFEIYKNDASNNVGWGIHLYRSSNNKIINNRADNCTRKGPNIYWTGDTSGLLLNCRSSDNIVSQNSFLYGGDGIFVSGFPRKSMNECCPSINNLFEGNDCSYSPNNAIEDTFSTGNVFINNICNGSDYGFWLGYSYGNMISGNQIRGNTRDGIAIDHGHENVIEANDFSGNNNGLNIFNDFIDHFPASQYGCLNLPKPSDSGGYKITGNRFKSNRNYGLSMLNITYSIIFNNVFNETVSKNAVDSGSESVGNYFFTQKEKSENVIGGPYIGGNFWSDYSGKDTNHDGIGDTELPYMGNGNIKKPGDIFPLVVYN